MGWKDLLDFDLGRLAGARPAPDYKQTHVYWWKAIWRIFRLPTPFADPPASTAVTSNVLRSARRITWKGPVYWNARSWRRDVVLVVEQLRGLIACNMPLPAGLAAAAQEELRIRSGWSPQRASALLRNVGLLALFTLICAGIAIEPNGLSSLQSIVLAGCAIALVAWFVWAVVINRNSRTRVFAALEHRLAMGMPLSQAMVTLPRFFPRHLADLVEAGETAGNVERAFDQFSDAMLRSLSLHRRLKLTLLYIKLILTAQFAILAFIIVRIVPVWAEIFQELGIEAEGRTPYLNWLPALGFLLPSLDQMVRFGAATAGVAWVAIPILLLVFLWAFLARFRKRRSWASRGMSSFLLVLPWFRGLVVRHNLGLIARMLHGLLRAGVPLDRALAMVMGADLLPAYQHWLSTLREQIQQGESVSGALVNTGGMRLIPPSFSGLIDAGERSGQLPATLERIADMYENEAEKRMQILAAMVLPAGIFVMGYITLCVQMLVFGSMSRLIETLAI